MPVVEEPVLESAPLAREAAPRLCRRDPDTGENCSWYHGFWQYLRALRLITTPEHHAEFFREAFGIASAVNSRPRILISGAADYCTLAHVLWACRQHAASPVITVVDLCETPLFLNRWYGERVAWAVQTHRADILDYESPETFDAVCTHSFFGRFAGPQRSRLISNWSRLLKPGGVAIAVNRVRGATAGDRLGFSPEQARAFRANVISKAETLREALDIDPLELGRRAEAYAARHRVHPVRSREEVTQMFEDGGLRVEALREIAVSKAVDSAVGGPTTLEGARYACIIARKPSAPSAAG